MPSSSSKISHRIQGNALVLLQFGLIVSLILMTNPADALRAGHLAVWGILGASALVGLAAVLANPPGNFNIRPDPKPGGRLVEHGIYRRVRHPMYTAVTLFGLGCVAATPSANAWLAAGFLFLVLVVKAMAEERALCRVHEGYADYMRRTERFVPKVF